MKSILLLTFLLNNPQDSLELIKGSELSIAKYVDRDMKRYHVWREIQTDSIFIVVRERNKFKKKYLNN